MLPVADGNSPIVAFARISPNSSAASRSHFLYVCMLAFSIVALMVLTFRTSVRSITARFS